MARQPKPWFRKQTGCWYVCIDGKQVNLGSDKDVAHRKYHEIMATSTVPTDDGQLIVILDKFLSWVELHRPKMYGFYRRYLQSFSDTHPNLKS